MHTWAHLLSIPFSLLWKLINYSFEQPATSHNVHKSFKNDCYCVHSDFCNQTDHHFPSVTFVARQDHRLKGMWHWCHRSYNLRVLGQPKRWFLVVESANRKNTSFVYQGFDTAQWIGFLMFYDVLSCSNIIKHCETATWFFIIMQGLQIYIKVASVSQNPNI